MLGYLHKRKKKSEGMTVEEKKCIQIPVALERLISQSHSKSFDIFDLFGNKVSKEGFSS